MWVISTQFVTNYLSGKFDPYSGMGKWVDYKIIQITRYIG